MVSLQLHDSTSTHGKEEEEKPCHGFSKVSRGIASQWWSLRRNCTFGDGEAQNSSRTYSGYSSFFDKHARHYETQFESLEQHFNAHLAEARTAMETLFLAPLMCPLIGSQGWEESTQGFNLAITSLKGQKLSKV